MRIFVINGSPAGEASNTLKLTRAFLEGMGETAEFFNVVDANVAPCRGCYACWYSTPGECVQKDDMETVLNRLCEAELVIWSTPLYCYGMPSGMKAVADRLLPLSNPAQYADAEGRTHHSARSASHARMMLISGCGFPERENNYDALIFQFRRMFGDASPMILCVEAPLMSIPEAAPVAEPYLELVRKAGAEFAKGEISEETAEALARPMYPPELYRKTAGS